MDQYFTVAKQAQGIKEKDELLYIWVHLNVNAKNM